MPNFVKIGGVTRKPLVDLTRNDPIDNGGCMGVISLSAVMLPKDGRMESERTGLSGSEV